MNSSILAVESTITLITYPIFVGLRPTVLGFSFCIRINFLMLILSVMFNCLYSLRHSTSLLFLKFMTSLMFILSASFNFFIHTQAPATAGFGIEQLVLLAYQYLELLNAKACSYRSLGSV